MSPTWTAAVRECVGVRVGLVAALVGGVMALPWIAGPANARAASAHVLPVGTIGADIAVGDDGSAFLVSRVAQSRSRSVPPVRTSTASPGAEFGPQHALLRDGRAGRIVDAGIASDGSGVIAIQNARGARRSVRVISFGARGRAGPAVTVSRDHAADFTALDVAPSGAAVVAWFQHGWGGRWRLEAAVREPGATAFGPARPVSAVVRRSCCTTVSAAIGASGDAAVTWTSTSRPAVWAAVRRPGHAFRRAQTLATNSSDDPRVAVGAGGTAAVLYSVQHVPRRPSDGLQVHRAVRGGAFGPAEHVNPGGGVTIGEAAVTPAGGVLIGWIDSRRERVRVSEAGPGEILIDAGELGAGVTANGLALAADEDGRAVVAWPERVSPGPSYRERVVAAVRPARAAPFGPAVALGRDWRAAQPEMARLVPGGGALVVWKGSRFEARPAHRSSLAVSRVP